MLSCVEGTRILRLAQLVHLRNTVAVRAGFDCNIERVNSNSILIAVFSFLQLYEETP